MAQMATPGGRGATIDERLFQSGVQRRTSVTVGEDSDASVLGRLHAARSVEIDLAGLARLVDLAASNRTPQTWTIDGDAFVSAQGGMRPLLHHGNLHVRGSLLLDEHAWLICTGELRVDGIVSDHRPSTLAVGGSVVAPRIVTTGNFFALGSVEATEVLLARDDAAPLRVAGCLRSPLVLNQRREIVAGSFDIERFVDLTDAARVDELRPHFSADAFAASGELDPERCERLLRCGLSVFRG